MAAEGKSFQILAVSGGGYRGLFAAKVLAELERQLGTPLYDHFDLLAGTSVGGLIVLGLAAGISAQEMATLLETHGPEVFKKRMWPLRGITRARHSDTGLKRVLDDVFGQKLLGELDASVIIPTLEASTGKAVVLKTPHHPDFKSDHLWRVSDVALATSAAPVYFPVFEHPDDHRQFVDGGLVANAPGFFGFHEATHFFKVPADQVRVLSIGTISIGRNLRAGGSRYAEAARLIPGVKRLIGDNALDKGVLNWGTQIFNVTISAQESFTDYMLNHVLAPGNYSHIDSKIDPQRVKDIVELDVCTAAATKTLTSEAASTAKRAVSDEQVLSFFKHQRHPYRWFHGPKSTSPT